VIGMLSFDWMSMIPMFLLVLTRISAFFIVAPIFAVRGVPGTFKVGLSVFVTMAAFSVVPIQGNLAWDGIYFLMILKELIVGTALGFIAYLFFTAVQVAGSFIDMQMGLGIANVIDPQTGAQSPLTGNLKFTFAVLLFLSLNGHHLMIDGVIQSYQHIPIDQVWPKGFATEQLTEFVIQSFVAMFTFAFQMAAPIVGVLFLTDVALGIISKAVPQMNVFVVGMPLKMLVGFAMMLVVVPGFLYLFQLLFKDLLQSMSALARILGGSG
jgi:flagellar biosynthetic protein FliR